MSDTSSSYIHDLIVALAGAFAVQIPGWFKGWRRDRDRAVTDQVALATLVTSVAKLEAAAARHEDDFDKFAAALRTRLKVLETVFAERTGEMPRLSRDTGECEASDE
jgi:hypothetical protein